MSSNAFCEARGWRSVVRSLMGGINKRRGSNPAGPVARLLSSSGIYILCNVFTRAIPFLLLPVLTRYLSPEDMGTVAMYTVGIAVVMPLVGFSTEAAISRQYFEKEEIDFPNYFTNCLYLVCVTTTAVWLGLLSFPRAIGSALGVPSSWVWTLAVVATARYLCGATLAVWQAQERPHAYSLLTVGQTLLNAGISLYLIVGHQFGWEGRAVGEMLGATVAAAVGLIFLVRSGLIKHGWSAVHLRHALKFGGGLMPHVYGGIIIAAGDRFFLTHMVGKAETGLYVVGAQVGMIIGILEHSFNQAWTPWLFERLKRDAPGERELVRRVTRLYNVGILGLALLLSALAPTFVEAFLGKDYRGATQFVFWLALGYAFTGMYKMRANQIFFANKTHLLSVVTALTGLTSLALNYSLIRLNGSVGAAQATAMALLISYLLTAFLSRRIEAVNAQWSTGIQPVRTIDHQHSP